MRLDAVVERLASLPDVLPAPPAALEARVLGPAGVLDPAGPRAPAASGLHEGAVDELRDAAALVLLVPDGEDEAHLLLIERPPGNHVHAGQIALPGGRREPGDAFPEGTALREASEEIGLDPASSEVRTLGRLDPVEIRVSGHLLVPVLATTARGPVLRRQRREVARILRLPVTDFLPGTPIETVEETRLAWRLRYGAYRRNGVVIWGATARILGQLGALLGDPVPGAGASDRRG